MPSVSDVLKRKLIFVLGKGGVGRTTLSEAIAHRLAMAFESSPTGCVWVVIEDPRFADGGPTPIQPSLWRLNCRAVPAFQEYVGRLLRLPKMARFFINHRLIQYLSEAGPGVREIVLLGKIWFERNHYEHVVVDMPSTGYSLAMFESLLNFGRLFQGGPVQRDTQAMLQTLNDPEQTGFILLTLPEEMPIQETFELQAALAKLFPDNPPAWIVNRVFPQVTHPQPDAETGSSPIPKSLRDYIEKRSQTEHAHIDRIQQQGIEPQLLPFIAHGHDDSVSRLARAL